MRVPLRASGTEGEKITVAVTISCNSNRARGSTRHEMGKCQSRADEHQGKDGKSPRTLPVDPSAFGVESHSFGLQLTDVSTSFGYVHGRSMSAWVRHAFDRRSSPVPGRPKAGDVPHPQS